MSSTRDEKWLEKLWQSHAGRVRAYLRRRVEADCVDDLLSEVFVVAWRHRNRKPAADLPWLYGIARKVVSTHQRAADRYQRLGEKLTSQPIGQLDDINRAELRGEILEALSALDDVDRELLLLTAWEGLAPREIAVATGSNSAAVRMRLSRARKRFELALETFNTPRIEGTLK